MRLLALVTDAFGAPGGIAQYNRDLFTALGGSQVIEHVDILPRNGTPPSKLPERLHQHNAQAGKLAYAAKALWLAKRNKPNRIFCGHINLLPLARWLARYTSAPIWLQLHGIDSWDKPRRIGKGLFDRVQLVTCVSRYTRRRFLTWANLDPSRVKVLPNTMTTPKPTQHDKALRVAPALEGKKVLLTVGRLAASEAYKGQDRVIKCLPELLRKIPNLVYLIAGDGDDRPRLEQLAHQQGVADQVRFFGKVSDDELDTLYHLADLFVMPSTGEGFGIVYLEAMARGTPALGLDANGSTDPLQDGKLGRVCDEFTLCQAIEQALATPPDPNLAQRTQDTFGYARFNNHVERLLNAFNAPATAMEAH